MSKNTFSVDYVIYNLNTNEIIDRKSMELKVTDKQIRDLAKVMENNGGYAPELSELHSMYEYLIEECINNYQECYAPDDDEFWEKNTIDFEGKIPDELLQVAENYVKYKEVNIIYYYEVNGEEKTGNAAIHLPTALYWSMVGVAKTKPSEREDFAHLKDTCPQIFDEVRRLVANVAGVAKNHFFLKEFPYQVLEEAMATCDDIIKEQESLAFPKKHRRITSQPIIQQPINMSSLKEGIDAILHDGTLSRKEKLSRLTRFVTLQEARALLGPEPEETIVLKKKLDFQGGELKILDLSINKVFFDEIIKGIKKDEYRNLTNYYRRRCTYEENGKSYLIPYDAIRFNVGKGEQRLSATVALTDIVCEGGFLIFHLGKILSKSNC